MRIIGGELKGRKIDYIKTQDVRPTKDKVRQALFNIVAPNIGGAKVLDLYSGSGAYAIEAISRGALSAVCVEDNFKCFSMIKENVSALKLEEKIKVIKKDVLRVFKALEHNNLIFDIIILDPPYYEDLPKKTLLKLIQYDILSRNNIIICEHHRQDILPDSFNGIKLLTRKAYGNTVLSFYCKSVTRE